MHRTAFILSITCLCLAACTITPKQKTIPHRYIAYSWAATNPALNNIIPFHWFGYQDVRDIDAMAEKALVAAEKMPDQHKTFILIYLRRALGAHPEDALRDKNGDPIGCHSDNGSFKVYPGVWWEHGVARVQEQLERLFKRYAEIGGQIDVLTMDFEWSNTYYYLYETATKYFDCGVPAYLSAIEQDHRFPALKPRLGFDDLSDLLYWNKTDHASRWDALTNRRTAEYVNQAVYEPLKKYFPDARLSNYDFFTRKNNANLPEVSGWSWRGFDPGIHIGTHQSRAFYGWLGNLDQQNIDGVMRYKKTPFNALRFEINHMRALRSPNEIPVFPWVSYKGFSESFLRQSDYYQELIFHLALSGVDQFLYWNPRVTEPPASEQDDALLNELLIEVNQLADTEKFEYVSQDLIPWDKNHVLSEGKLNGKRIWRFTPELEPGQQVQSVIARLEPAEFLVEGRRISIDAGRIAEQQSSLSNKGLWVIERE